MQGRILVAEQDGLYIVRLVGDVRVTLCTAADSFLDRMFSDRNFKSIIIDLVEATGIDSTSLGLLARISVEAEERLHYRPTLVACSPDVLRILESVGFEDVFHIVDECTLDIDDIRELPQVTDWDEDQLRERVIQAHRTLMELNARNAATFRDLVTALEMEAAQTPVAACAAR